MSPYEFQADRSDALRRQLIQFPASLQRGPEQTKVTCTNDPILGGTNPVNKHRHLGLRLGAGTVAGALICGALALTLVPTDRSEDASRIIESLTYPQQEADKLPSTALPSVGSVGVDPAQTRLLGHSNSITYYGAPASGELTPGAPSGKAICIIPVTATGESKALGCTLLKNFESYGLKVETPDKTEAGWLIVPAAAKTSMESVKDEGGWVQQAPNFLVRNND
ncbi:hypothetical protein ABFP37_10075 [Burkholderia sp. RS01]|uniref:hypothetical protein n=1 Tax=unclassified Burkholderia TaxID=2613784 RepID=UPI0032189323